jgi:hypothetical protein
VSDLVYLYGFVPADASPPSNLDGMAERPVALIDVGAVRAAVSRVPAEIYAADRIEPRLQDLSWVARQGVAHETVVAWFVDHSEILPASLFTLYSGDDALRSAAAARVAQLAAELARLKHKREWDLKVAVDERELEQHAVVLSPRIAALEREAAEATPGKRYLLERKRADLLKSETRNAAHALANDVFAAVKAIAVEHRLLPLPRTSDDLPVILHGALLVERNREMELVAELESAQQSLAGKGLTLSFSGPWAPYRFIGEHERAADRD